ncbi:MAG: hypothetical protein K0R67_3389, partial [Paenibacillus sp.]|nr:hypothetical protein [Paenibacillus sp.]
MENALLQHARIEPGLLESIPIEQIKTSPLLQKAQCEELMHRGELQAAREGLSKAIKQIAELTLRKPLLSALSLLAVINIRMGLIQEAAPIVRFLRDEWDICDEEIGGEVAYALARGMFLLGDDAGDSDEFYRYAIYAFDRDGEAVRGSLTLFELAMKGHMVMSPMDWEERMAEFAQRVRRRQAGEALLGYLQASRLLADGKPEQAEQALLITGSVEMPQQLPYLFQAMISLLQLKIAIRLRNSEHTERTLAYLKSLHLESTVDLEWQFEWASAQFELAVSHSEQVSARMFVTQARAIFMQGLPPRFGVWLDRMNSTLEGEQNTDVPAPIWDADVGSLWRCDLFGGFKFTRRDGRTVQSIRWKRKKTKELALFLLLQQGFSATREHIAEALYPNHEPDKMSNQLYVAAHQLKTVMRDYFGVDGGIVIKDGIVYLKDRLIGEV